VFSKARIRRLKTLGARQSAQNAEAGKGQRRQRRRFVFIWNLANPGGKLVLDRTNQAPIGVIPEPSQSNYNRQQRADQEKLAASSVPEKEPESRENNHQDGVYDRYPGNNVFAYNGTMIKADLNKKDTESCHQDEYNSFVESPEFRRKENMCSRMETFKRENQPDRLFAFDFSALKGT
jgi:hypothetical protein